MPKQTQSSAENVDYSDDPNFAGFVDEIVIDLKKADEQKPHPKMIEECKLSIKLQFHRIHNV